MRKLKTVLLSFLLLMILTTYNPNSLSLDINVFKIKVIEISNDKIINEKKLLNTLYTELYDTNLFFLKNEKVLKIIDKNKIIKRLEIKKIYPDKLHIKIYEKDPIAIVNKNKQKFYLINNGEEIDYFDNLKLSHLPNIFGNQENFLKIYSVLNKNNFPISDIKSFYYFDIGRWDIIMKDQKIIKLPTKNFNESVKNFLRLESEINFEKYKIFDYRIKDQLILK